MKSTPIFYTGIVLGIIIIAIAAYMHFELPYYTDHPNRFYAVLAVGILFALGCIVGLLYSKRNTH